MNPLVDNSPSVVGNCDLPNSVPTGEPSAVPSSVPSLDPSSTPSTFPSVQPSDDPLRAVLDAIFDSTNGDEWVTDNNWDMRLTIPDICDLTSVVCEDVDIIELDLCKSNVAVVSHCVQSPNTTMLT